VLWPWRGGPIVLAVYYTQPHKAASANNAIIVAATRIVVDALV
jgi:beta-lactamase class A